MNIEHAVREYRKPLTYFVFGIVKNRDDADDIVSETFEKALQSEYKPIGSYKGWLFTIAKNKSIDYLRLKNRSIEMDQNLPTPEDLLISRDQVRNIYDAIEKVKYKSILKLHLKGFKNEDIAELAGVSNGQIRQLLFRAKKQLKQLL